ncbi:zinc finger protein 91-like isoform X2 [Melanotaenia boesemani]|uniref:zinc finger protein 91-like isoform X2 n=1 Tax=Melanotaenia boesemani TaxID=1250792 RepID=UPI001C05C516|nr:zinc finger protein 91-like isoform X2 [Melanotaenia boesemani]
MKSIYPFSIPALSKSRLQGVLEPNPVATGPEAGLPVHHSFQTRHMSSSPSKRPIESRPARVTEESGDEDIHNKGALLGCRETEEVGVELSMYSLSNTEDEQEDSTDEDEVNLSARGTKYKSGMCSIHGCDSWCRSAQQFKLPEDPERRLEWVMFLAKVNKQCFKESSWTDITVCSEHFTDDCLVNLNGIVQLKAGAVPTCLNSGLEDPVESHRNEPVDNSEAVGNHDQLKTHEGPNSCSEESGLASLGFPSGASCSADSSLRSQIQPKCVNADLINEKAALLKEKGKFPVNEKRLLQLFGRNCPSCGAKLLMYKVTRGVVISMHQLCRKCDYTYQWKNQVDGNVPAAENGPPTRGSEATPADEASSNITGAPEVGLDDDEESDSMNGSNESSNPDDTDSDEDWNPSHSVYPMKLLHAKTNEDSNEDEEECNDNYYPALTPQFSQLCTDCGKFFDKRRPHICEHKLKPFSCNICGSRCINKHALNIHSRIHNENYEFRCKYCHAAFKLKADKITHEQVHMTQGTPYKCPECSETFATNKERKIHLEDHRGPNAFNCRICNVKFRSQKDYERHVVVHTGEKPFKCSVCQRGFTQAGNLKSHMRLHTGERPYKCQHCGKCFNHNVSLKSHIQRYHTASTGPEQKNDMNKSDADGAQRSGSKRGADSEFGGLAEEQDSNDGVQMDCLYRPKCKKRSTGRPIGRPKRSGSEQVVGENQAESQDSNREARKSQVKRRKRKARADEEGEGEPSDINTDCEENREKPRDTSEHSGLD